MQTYPLSMGPIIRSYPGPLRQSRPSRLAAVDPIRAQHFGRCCSPNATYTNTMEFANAPGAKAGSDGCVAFGDLVSTRIHKIGTWVSYQMYYSACVSSAIRISYLTTIEDQADFTCKFESYKHNIPETRPQATIPC